MLKVALGWSRMKDRISDFQGTLSAQTTHQLNSRERERENAFTAAPDAPAGFRDPFLEHLFLAIPMW